MSQINAGRIIASTGIQLPQFNNNNRPSGNAGLMIYNIEEEAVQVWSGTEWFNVGSGGGPDGSSAEKAAGSAVEILAINPGATDGVYWLNHGQGAYQAYCDMTNGGWILVAKIASSTNPTGPWTYNGANWNSSSPVSESACQNLDAGSALNRGYYQFTLQSGFRMVLGLSNISNALTVSRSGATAKNTFTGATIDLNGTFTRNDFMAWYESGTGRPRSDFDTQPNCNRIGINRTDSASSAMRFGITMNNENECNSNDSALGFGCYTNGQSTSGDRNVEAGGFRWNPTVRYPSQGYIFVK